MIPEMVIQIREYEKKIAFFGVATIILKLLGILSGETALAMTALFAVLEITREIDDLHDQLEKLREEVEQGGS